MRLSVSSSDLLHFAALHPALRGREGDPGAEAGRLGDAQRRQHLPRHARLSRREHIAGKPRRRRIGLSPGKQRLISTAKNQESLPGKVARGEGMPSNGDAAVDEAYDGLGHTFDFFFENYQRNSIDDEGLALNATVHYGKRYNNAFWNGQRMVFGDGDGKLFNRFTIALDVIGHELGHGVTEDETGLAYFQQPGALNEHLSDVWGSLIKQWVLKQTAAKADWLIGAGLLAAGVNGKALRSMKAPGTAFDDPVLAKDPQPEHMDQYVDTFQDHGGVHINSGIRLRAGIGAARHNRQRSACAGRGQKACTCLLYTSPSPRDRS